MVTTMLTTMLTMAARRLAQTATILATAFLLHEPRAMAGPERVAYPETDLAGYLLYQVVNRPDNNQVRYLYANDLAVKGAREGDQLPAGAKLILEAFKAKLDENGDPVEDANGSYMKGEQAFYTIMEKQEGWGQDYPAELRNGDWDYAVILPDKSHKAEVAVEKCLTCHLEQVGPEGDFVFSLDSLIQVARALQVGGAVAEETVAPASSQVATASGDAAKGEKLFRRCKACHIADQSGTHKIGPNLFAVVGRGIGVAEGYKYSKALIGLQGGTWDAAALDAWLTNPKAFAKGTKMSFPGFKKPTDRADVIAYLESLK